MPWRMEAGSSLDCTVNANADAQEEQNATECTVHTEKGSLQHGCTHYRRRCKIRAPCCNEVFDCRHCHNEAKAVEKDDSKRHEIVRHKIEKVICSICDTEQSVQQTCENCGVCMGEYFCSKCKFFDDDISKEQFHCDACGICRVGGKENFFHCERCGCCYTTSLQNKHICVENSMEHNCPVCFEYMFDSLKAMTVLLCGHTMHVSCLAEMYSHSQFSCPICSKSVCNMSWAWQQLNLELALTPMPEAYQNKMVWILCNDCGASSEVLFHVIALQCTSCKSYNTRQTKGPLPNRGSGSC